MVSLSFDREFNIESGPAMELSPLVRRVLADNPGPFTFKGTASFIVGRGQVAIIDPGPDSDQHLAALLAAVSVDPAFRTVQADPHFQDQLAATALPVISG